MRVERERVCVCVCVLCATKKTRPYAATESDEAQTIETK